MQLPEILVANGACIVLMVFLLMVRAETKENKWVGEWLYEAMIHCTIMSAVIEALSFVMDGKLFPGNRTLQFVLNSVLFVSTCGVGMLWVFYTDLRIYHSLKRLKEKAFFYAVPFILECLAVIANMIHPGILFTVTEENVYQRNAFCLMTMLILFYYLACSIVVWQKAKYKRKNVEFFPIYHLAVPCIAGTAVQAAFYGITAGWLATAIGLLFVYVQLQKQNSYIDSLSGLYNRGYMMRCLGRCDVSRHRNLCGIMIDVNDFKAINDHFGHAVGDDAIRVAAHVLEESVSEEDTVIRYGGDEFIVFTNESDESKLLQKMEDIRRRAQEFNESGRQIFNLTFSMGYSRFIDCGMNRKTFLLDMDKKMYEAKRDYYTQSGMDRRHG